VVLTAREWVLQHVPSTVSPSCVDTPESEGSFSDVSLKCELDEVPNLAYYDLFSSLADLDSQFEELAEGVTTGGICATDIRSRGGYTQLAPDGTDVTLGELVCQPRGDQIRRMTWSNRPLGILAEIHWTGGERQQAFDAWEDAGPVVNDNEFELFSAIPDRTLGVRQTCLMQRTHGLRGPAPAVTAECRLPFLADVVNFAQYEGVLADDALGAELDARGIPRETPGDDWCGTPGVRVASGGWLYGDDTDGGLLACEVEDGRAYLIWTDRANNVMGIAIRNDGDLNALFNLWDDDLVLAIE
jgi:hypothetical protein